MIDPYKNKMFKKNPYFKKKPVKGEIIVVLDGYLDNRQLKLITPISRCVKKNEVHELIITEENVKPGDTVDKIAYLGFFECENSGVIVSGDKVLINNKYFGEIAGFDETHMPNHLNIVIKNKTRISGAESCIDIQNTILITK
ncbi:MAG: hypothetical protein PWP21_166 [Thermosediminibacterales bacterium]|nr:hypothetical protein [Thermosediminibacterales bacterium]